VIAESSQGSLCRNRATAFAGCGPGAEHDLFAGESLSDCRALWAGHNRVEQGRDKARPIREVQQFGQRVSACGNSTYECRPPPPPGNGRCFLVRLVLFNSVVFLFAFLPVTYVVFWTLRSANSRYIWLTATGYVFYGYWNWRFCFLMALSTLVSYVAGLGFLRWDGDARLRKLCLWIPIVVDLSLLGFFKYANFAMSTVHSFAHWFGTDVSVPHLNIILPIGISFYTFHTISYIVDSYRRVIRPTRNFFEFSAYVSLFSQLIAGPIVRFRQIEEDLGRIGTHHRTKWLWRGVSFFAVGLIEKVVIADTLAAFVDPALQHYATLSTLGAWLAMLGYSFQIYFDFSGYSSMAAGLGYLFGLRIPQNFNSPYKALDPSDFWRRWHISLSTCLRDYIYIPLGGNRRGEGRAYYNLIVTMLIGGLWHGANWTFVVWGAYHGLLLAIHKKFAAQWDSLPKAFRQPFMFLLALVGWVFFRSTEFGMATSILRTMFVPTEGVVAPQAPFVVFALFVAGWWSMVGPNVFEMRHSFTFRQRAFATVALAVCLALIMGTRSSPFLYFQF
jgi:alginate O-acetyltransferase complex protein AlgI